MLRYGDFAKRIRELHRLTHPVPVQQEILKRLDPNLGNLTDLVDQAAEGAFGYRIVKNCPWDCPSIPEDLKVHVGHMVETFGSDQFSIVVRDLLGGEEPRNPGGAA